MKFSRLSDAVLNRNSVWAVLLVLIIFLYAGCGGNDDGQVLPNLTGADKVTSFGDLTKVTVKDMALTDKNADEYYARLEKILNGEYSSLSNAPKKAAGTPYLTNMTLSIRTDEVQALGNYNLADTLKITATANFSDGTTEIVTPAWMVYSGPNSLVDNIYTAPAAAGQTVFIAYFSKDGVTRFAIFRLTVNNMSLLNLSMAADAVQASGNYDLSSITVYAKSSNGTSRDVTAAPNTKWSLLSGRGTLNGNIYTAPAMADTAIFLVQYTEAGVIESAQFTLKINGLTAVSLNKTTDEIQLPETYDLGSELIVSAKYSSGSTLEVTHAPGLIWTLTSGSGTLAGTVYTPTAKVETAVFTGSYTESGITKTTTFQLKAIGLSSLSLNKTTDEVQSCANYSLADNLILTDKLSNGTTTNRTMDPNTKWTLVSGRGALNGMVYTAPALAETAVIAATYTEAGITKTINFRLRVNALISLTLSKTTDETVISAPYDIASKLVVFAKFSSGQTKEVTTNPNLRWTISFGSGMLNGAIYTTPERIETAVIVATYTENGVAQSARFSLKVSATAPGTKILLVGLTINKSTDAVQINGTYDLGSLAAIGKYLDKTTREVTLSWIVTSGGGSVSGNIYTAPANAETVRIMGSCIAEDGSVKSVYITLSVYGTEIYGTRGVVTSAGAKFHLSNGFVFEIPPNSVNATGEIEFLSPNSLGIIKAAPGQKFFTCTSTSDVYKMIIRIPLKSGMTQDDVAMCVIMPHLDEIISPEPTIEDTTCVFVIGSTPSLSSALRTPDRALKNGAKVILGGKYKTEFTIKLNDSTVSDALKEVTQNSLSFNWPYYRQYYATCFATTWLMLMKGYKIQIDGNRPFDSIYKITNTMMHNEIGFEKGDADGAIVGGGLAVPGFEKSIYDLVDHKDESIANLNVVGLTNSMAGLTVTAYICEDVRALMKLAPIINSKGNPIKVDSRYHSILIRGYEMDDDKSVYRLYVSNPMNSKNDIATCYSSRGFSPSEIENSLFGGNQANTPLICYAIETKNRTETEIKTNKLSGSLQTIHLSDNDSDPSLAGIKLYDNKDSMISYTEWNPSGNEEAITWSTKACNGNASKLKNIMLMRIPIYNTEKTYDNTEKVWKDAEKSVAVRLCIYNKTKTQLITSKISVVRPDKEEIFTIKTKTDKPLFNFLDNEELVADFIEELKTNAYDDLEYKLVVELLDGVNNDKILDSFDVNFKFLPPLFIEPNNKIDFMGNDFRFTASVGSQDVTNQATWKVEPLDDNVEADFVNGLLKTKGEITASKEYTVTATYKDSTDLIKTSDPVKIKVLPSIIPNKKALFVGQSFQFKLGTELQGNSSDHIIWSATGGTIDQTGYFIATNGNIGSPEIHVTLKKGATIKSGETFEILEADLIAKPATLQILDFSIKPDKTFIDFNKITYFQLIENISGGVYPAGSVDWSATSGTVDVSGIAGNTNDVMKYKPSIPGKSIITAKLKKGFMFRLGFTLVEDIEQTIEVTIIKIECSPKTLSARSTPIDAIGNPMDVVHYPDTNYGTTADFTISVDGADVPIGLTIAEGENSGKGTLSSISKTGNKDQLPVKYNFNFKPATSTKIYYDSNDTIHFNITCLDSVDSSTVAALLIYRPILETIEKDCYPGIARGVFQVVKYSSMLPQEFIYNHGYYRAWYIADPTKTCEEANYFCGQGWPNNSSRHYAQDTYLIEICDFGRNFLDFEYRAYKYEYSGGQPITKITVVKYTRPDFYSSWSTAQSTPTPLNGWMPPPAALQPIQPPIPDQPITVIVPVASPQQK